MLVFRVFDSRQLPRTHPVCVSVLVIVSLCLDIRVEPLNSWGSLSDVRMRSVVCGVVGVGGSGGSRSGDEIRGMSRERI